MTTFLPYLLSLSLSLSLSLLVGNCIVNAEISPSKNLNFDIIVDIVC